VRKTDIGHFRRRLRCGGCRGLSDDVGLRSCRQCDFEHGLIGGELDQFDFDLDQFDFNYVDPRRKVENRHLVMGTTALTRGSRARSR
jgi:hypothetical protein